MRSSDVCKAVLHETFQMLPVAGNTDMAINDRRRCGQVYPGGLDRRLWDVMQSPSTRTGMLSNNYSKQ